MMHFNPNPPFKAYYFRQIDPVYEELRQQAINLSQDCAAELQVIPPVFIEIIQTPSSIKYVRQNYDRFLRAYFHVFELRIKRTYGIWKYWKMFILPRFW